MGGAQQGAHTSRISCESQNHIQGGRMLSVQRMFFRFLFAGAAAQVLQTGSIWFIAT